MDWPACLSPDGHYRHIRALPAELPKAEEVAFIGFGACSIVFFAFLYQDTLVLDRMETAAERLVSRLPFGTRVIETIWSPDDSRVSFIGHLGDRACIGHCFSYANYEPASGQFRIRVRPGSPLVSASDDDTEDMQSGEYQVQAEDLPGMQLFQCDEKTRQNSASEPDRR